MIERFLDWVLGPQLADQVAPTIVVFAGLMILLLFVIYTSIIISKLMDKANDRHMKKLRDKRKEKNTDEYEHFG